MTVRESFNRAAPRYDALRRTLIPCFDDFYGTAVDLLESPRRVLDLGAGTGLMAAFVRERFPDAHLTLLDVAEDMLKVARERFAGDERVAFRIGDYAGAALGGPYDAIVSALSIHHLEHPDKRALFGRLFTALAPGGRFVNADQVEGETPAIDALHKDMWLRQIRARGIGEEELAAARQRQTHDRMAPLDDQLGWLREAGFVDAHCAYKSWNFVVFSATRPA